MSIITDVNAINQTQPVTPDVAQANAAQRVLHFVTTHIPKISADTLEWLTIVVLHCVTVPTMLALMAGLTDKTPGLDMVLFVWGALVLMFARSILLKNAMNTVTNGAGFIAQSVMMALVLFK